MNFIVEENAIYYMDENREKKRRGNISENWMSIPWRLIIPLFLPLSGEPVWQGN